MIDQGQAVFLRKMLMTLIAVIGAVLLWKTFHMVLLIFLGTIVGVFLRKSGEWIRDRTGVSIEWSMIGLIGVLVLVAAAGLWVMLPKIHDQVRELSQQLPDSLRALRTLVSRNDLGNWIIRHLPPPQELSGSLGGVLNQATAWLYSFFGALTGILIIGVIGLYLAFGARLSVQGIVKLVPPHKRDRARRILHALAATLFWWVIGRLVSMTIIGATTFLGLWALGVPLAFSLGLFAALMTFIPNIGPILSVIPALLLALQDGLGQAGYVLLLYATLQTLESYFITPLIQRRNIAMPPALILSAQLVMGVLQGVLGILAATPLMAALLVLVKLIYIQDILGDTDVQIEAEHH